MAEAIETLAAASTAQCQLLTEILGELRRMNAAERVGAISNVKITLQRGTIDINVHAYTGSNVEEAEQEALESYRRILEELNQDGTEAFKKTLEVLRSKA